MDAVNYKTCSKCGETKPATEFRKGRRECKACGNAYIKAWRDANPEKVKAHYKAWKDANPEKVRAYSKAWRDANPEKNRARVKAWMGANPERAKAYDISRRQELTDGYVALALRIPVADCPPELIELKRQQLALHRLTKQLTTTIQEKQNAAE